MYENPNYSTNKAEMYDLMSRQLESMIDGIDNVIPNLANASALIFDALKEINWAGFYLIKDDYLLLGPFQGKPACVKIPVGRGVCGTAVNYDKIMIVNDVHEFEGHIACDSASNSEIVIPIKSRGKIVGVLDIDSPVVARFDDGDKRGLSLLVSILERGCNWSEL